MLAGAVGSASSDAMFALMLLAAATSVLFGVVALVFERRRLLGAFALSASLVLPILIGALIWWLMSLPPGAFS